MPSDTSHWRRPAQHFPLFPHLAIVPALLAVATAISLFAHSDVNAALLWSQCHARSVLPALSRVPVLGTPACFLVSFFHAALDSFRSKAVISVILGFVGSLLTVSTVESARRVNAKNPVVSMPTLPWMVFNLVGGALVWQLVIAPAFILGAKAWPAPENRNKNNRRPAAAGDGHGDGDGEEGRGEHEHDAAVRVDEGRRVAQAEVIAIPLAVTLGYYVPSAWMLAATSPAAIGAWLFFPVYVSLARQSVRYLLTRMGRFRSGRPTIHLESHAWSLAAVYAVPILCSLLAHGFMIGNLTRGDDRKELTRSAVQFIEIDFQFIGLTFLYWVFVEVGWRAPLAIVGSSVLLGPGAGTALGWLYREKLITSGLNLQLSNPVEEEEEEEEGVVQNEDEERGRRGQADEQTPLIR
ncbi:hypothetical protein C2857_000717 [Epichloe festucae Fl1]|uniref:Uncharacterized protein n=1 Tax=Epichloe festucae (strain Fl1) TaxID=877507 RepID=A0A7S9KU36_EPIFF|nr:hypothetical protein C2857_000717 [Epichloe festucae Fl1]